ncbi:hypothetical protein C8F01DRAFT_1091992 [Mycena amicta]|nr:hypothetical protein C8F01DRAFT_1091992 [Mycena amicta]
MSVAKGEQEQSIKRAQDGLARRGACRWKKQGSPMALGQTQRDERGEVIERKEGRKEDGNTPPKNATNNICIHGMSKYLLGAQEQTSLVPVKKGEPARDSGEVVVTESGGEGKRLPRRCLLREHGSVGDQTRNKKDGHSIKAEQNKWGRRTPENVYDAVLMFRFFVSGGGCGWGGHLGQAHEARLPEISAIVGPPYAPKEDRRAQSGRQGQGAQQQERKCENNNVARGEPWRRVGTGDKQMGGGGAVGGEEEARGRQQKQRRKREERGAEGQAERKQKLR